MNTIFALVLILMVKSDHNFAHVTTAELSWHVQNCDMLWSLSFKSKQPKYLWDINHELINSLLNGPRIPDALEPGSLMWTLLDIQDCNYYISKSLFCCSFPWNGFFETFDWVPGEDIYRYHCLTSSSRWCQVDAAVFGTIQIVAYLVHNMSKSHVCFGVWPFCLDL